MSLSVRDSIPEIIPSSKIPVISMHDSSPPREHNAQTLVLLSVIVLLLLSNFKKLSKKLSQNLQKIKQVEGLNGPRAYPIIGNVPHLLYDDFFKWTETMCKRWGDPLRLWKFNRPIIFVSTYKIAHQLLSKSYFNAKYGDLDMIRRLKGGKGLSTTHPHDSAQRRKLLQSGYNKNTVENQVPVFSSESKQLLTRLEKFAETQQEFDIVDYLLMSAFKMSCCCSFGVNFMSERSDAEALLHMDSLHTFADNFGNRILGSNFLKRSDWIYFNLFPDGRKAWECHNTINSFAQSAIKNRRAERDAEKSEDEATTTTHSENVDNESDESKKTHACFLDLLLDLEEQGIFQEDDIIGDLNNFLAGAYDTVALTVTWTLYLLSMNPSHQEAAVEELKSVLGTKPSQSIEVTARDTKNFKYLELCIKETLRLYPTAPFFPRSTCADVTLDDGRTIPAGCDVLIMANMINREAEYFPNPDQFQPERHEKQIRQFMPFSAGPRNCIGQIHAIYMVKVMTAYLLKEFKWETVDKPEDIKYTAHVLLCPVDGVHFKITKRATSVTDQTNETSYVKTID